MDSRLVNIKTRNEEILPDDQIPQAVMAGTHAYEAGTKVQVKTPWGENVMIPAEKVPEAFRVGYSPYGAVQKYVEENDNFLGDLKVFGGQLADEALLGLPELGFDLKADPLAVAKKNALKDAHELSNAAGGVSGFGLGLFLGSPLWKAASTSGEVTAKATEALATNLAARAGVNISERAALSAARTIAGKMTGGAVEGAVSVMPHALTESLLGDPELAGESLLWGGGVGALFGGTLGAAGELLGAGKNVAKKAYSWLEGKEVNAENLKKAAFKHGLGIEDDMIEYRLANRERMDAHYDMTPEDIAEQANQSKNKYLLEEDQALEAYKRHRVESDDLIKHEEYRLANDKPGLEIGDELNAAIGEVKAKQGQLSEAADLELENATLKLNSQTEKPITWRKQDIQSDITRAIKDALPRGAKAANTDELRGVVTKLEALRDRIKTNYDAKDLTGIEMRDLLREIRAANAAAYDKSAGTYNEPLAKALKSVAEGMQKRVKDKLNKYGYTRYAEIMDEMSALARNQRKADKFFGRPEQAYASLRNYTGTRNAEMERVLGEFDALNGTNFVEKLKKYKDAKDLLTKSKLDGKDEILKVVSPEKYELLKSSEKQLADLVARNAPIRRLGPDSTLPKVRNLMRKNYSPETREAFEALSQLEGHTPGQNDFLSMIEDRVMNDRFDASRINGSRRVNTGAAVGAGIGSAMGSIFGPVGAAIGAVAGAVVDVDGGKIAKRLIDGDTFFGPLFVEKSMAQGATKLDRMGDILKKMKARGDSVISIAGGPAKLSAIQDIVEALTGDRRKDRSEAASVMNEKLGDWVNNPDAMIEDIGRIMGPIADSGAPDASAIATQRMTTAINYLHTHLPKPPRPKSPFAPAVRWKPSDYELKGFYDRLETIIDPFSSLDHLENGTLTRFHMEAIKTVYPSLHGIIQKRVLDTVVTDGEDLDLNSTDRIKLSLLLDMPLDHSMMEINRYQQTFMNQSPDEPQAQDGGYRADVSLSHQMRPDSAKRGEDYA